MIPKLRKIINPLTEKNCRGIKTIIYIDNVSGEYGGFLNVQFLEEVYKTEAGFYNIKKEIAGHSQSLSISLKQLNKNILDPKCDVYVLDIVENSVDYITD